MIFGCAHYFLAAHLHQSLLLILVLVIFDRFLDHCITLFDRSIARIERARLLIQRLFTLESSNLSLGQLFYHSSSIHIHSNEQLSIHLCLFHSSFHCWYHYLMITSLHHYLHSNELLFHIWSIICCSFSMDHIIGPLHLPLSQLFVLHGPVDFTFGPSFCGYFHLSHITGPFGPS